MEPNITTIDYNAVLVDLKKKRDELNKAISGIEVMLGISSSATAPAGITAQSNLPVHIQEDTFFGMSIVEAAAKYLAMKKKTQTTKQIAEALEAGGLQNQSGNFGNTVGSVLNRNADSSSPTFVNISRGTWGLASWYGGRRAKSKNGDNGNGNGKQDENQDVSDLV